MSQNQTPASSSETSSKDTNSSTISPNALDDSESKSTYLSIFFCDQQLGIAYYETDTALIHMLLETIEGPPFHLICNLIEELQPTTVITSAKQNLNFLDSFQSSSEVVIDRSMQGSTISNSTVASPDKNDKTYPFSLEMLSSVEFRFEASKLRLLAVDLPGIPTHFSDMERMLHMSSLIPFESVASVRAAGGLLRYLEKKRVGVMLENETMQTPILGFQTFSFKNVMHIGKASYATLQIFQTVSHPSAYKVSSKEGLSLFGILNRTTTRHGQKLLRAWFYRPTLDKTVLKRRLDLVSFLVDPRKDEMMNTMKNHLKQVKNVTRMISKMKTSKLNVADWIGIWQTCQSALAIADICRNVSLLSHQQSKFPLFEDIVKYFATDLAGIMTMIANCMDMKASKQESHFVVVAGVSSVVDEMKNMYSKLPSILGTVAQQELENYKEFLSACQIVYMRRIGYLLFVGKDAILKDPQPEDSRGMKFIASTDETVFYKTPATEKLDLEFGDILENIAYHEMEVMSQLQSMITKHSAVFVKVMQFTAELDCVLSFATAAKEYRYIRPNLTDSPEIKVNGSRHPLQEHAVSLFVPNNIHFGPDDGLVKILTGPNASGKSVYLKQVGLIVYMAHIGCFVPAENASIGLLSCIYTVIRSPESLSMRLSTFANDLNYISSATQKANSHSLVLMDEFGKGTATLDGVSLLASCLTHMLEKKEVPLVLCATHFHCLARQSLLPSSSMVRFQVMDTITSPNTDTVYLYQLIGGVSGKSYAATVARTAGIPTEIVARGQEVSEIIRCNAPVRRFNRTSAISYQNRCNKLANHVQKFYSINEGSIRQLVQDIKVIMDEQTRYSSSSS